MNCGFIPNKFNKDSTFKGILYFFLDDNKKVRCYIVWGSCENVNNNLKVEERIILPNCNINKIDKDDESKIENYAFLFLKERLDKFNSINDSNLPGNYFEPFRPAYKTRLRSGKNRIIKSESESEPINLIIFDNEDPTGITGFFSDNYESKFEINGVEYSSVKQWIECQKLRFHDYSEAKIDTVLQYDRITFIEDETKDVEILPQWLEEEYHHVKILGLMAKCLTVRDCYDKLMELKSTSDKTCEIHDTFFYNDSDKDQLEGVGADTNGKNYGGMYALEVFRAFKLGDRRYNDVYYYKYYYSQNL